MQSVLSMQQRRAPPPKAYLPLTLCASGKNETLPGLACEGARGSGAGQLEAGRCAGAGAHPRIPYPRQVGGAVPAGQPEPGRGITMTSVGLWKEGCVDLPSIAFDAFFVCEG